MMDNASLMLYAGNAIRIGILIFVGIPFLIWVKRMFSTMCAKRFSQHSGILLGRIIFYAGLMFIVFIILHELGFNVSALLGAAGVFGFALAFASQTSISNIISGFFLILEHPFYIGDMIKSNDVVGIVESIDLLSVRIRTIDNKLVRLPNETVLKSNLTNLSFYPTKRVECIVSVPYVSDTALSIKIIEDVIAHNSLFLSEPAPIVAVNKVGQLDYDTEMRLFIVLRVWVAKEKFTSAPAVLMQQLKDEFDKVGIIITIVSTG